MGGVAKTVKGVVTNPGRGILAIGSGGLTELNRNAPGLGNVSKAVEGGLNRAIGYKGSGGNDDPFGLDPYQSQADQEAINALGEKQYQETINDIPRQVKASLDQSLPGLAEDYNAGHVLNSSAWAQEIARQQSQLASNLVTNAISGRQGFQTSALQRGLGLEDFVNQAKVAKAIGAASAPAAPNSKATGLAGGVAGAGAGAKIAGPTGGLYGGLAGLALGSSSAKGK